MLERTRAFFGSTFRDLPWWKRKLIQVSILLIVVGGGAFAYTTFVDHESPWSASALRAGAGGFFGFVLGAAMRLFLKIGLLLGALVAAAVWGLAHLGWIDVPWGSFGEVTSAIGGWITHQFDSLQTALSGYLPASAMTGVGLASGLTTKPDVDLNPFDGE